MKYKPEVDGLRAVAVMLVLFCHVQLILPGGFIGVDVFFVISGFLITSIIVSGLEKNNFSFIQFYAKRFIRLYPALLVMVALVLIAGFVFASSSFLASIAESAKYVVTSLSNIYFRKHQGYFDISAQQQAFLHTWTLGVEWQFYLLAPALIWLVMKIFHSKRVLFFILLAVVLYSLVSSELAVRDNMAKAYYHMPYRAYELGLGGLLALVYSYRFKPLAAVAMTTGGLICILLASYFYSASTPFPGIAGLLPAVGTAACIWGAKDFSKGNLFRLSPMIYVGKISYSVYLFHWPLIVFYSYITLYRPLLLADKLLLFVLSFVGGMLLYHGIETRMTWRKLKHWGRACVLILLSSAALFCISSWLQKNSDQLNWRLSVQPAQDTSIYSQKNYSIEKTVGDLNGQPLAVLMGDSLGYNYIPGFDEQLQNSGYYLYSEIHELCYLIDDQYSVRNSNTQGCKNIYDRSFALMQENSELPLIMAQEWRIKGMVTNLETGQEQTLMSGDPQYKAFLFERLGALRQKIGSRDLILVGSPPYVYAYDGNSGAAKFIRPSCAQRPTFIFDVCKNEHGNDYLLENSMNKEVNDWIREFAQTHPHTYYIDPAIGICPKGICNTGRDEELYKENDLNHLSVHGSRVVAPVILKEIMTVLGGVATR